MLRDILVDYANTYLSTLYKNNMLCCVSNYELIHYWSIMTICPYIYILYYKCRRLLNVQIPMTIFTSLLINHLRLASMLALYLLNATTELSHVRCQTNPAVTKWCSAIYYHFVTEATITDVFKGYLQGWAAAMRWASRRELWDTIPYFLCSLRAWTLRYREYKVQIKTTQWLWRMTVQVTHRYHLTRSVG